MSGIAVILSWSMPDEFPNVIDEYANKTNVNSLFLLRIPDSFLAEEATDILREHSTDHRSQEQMPCPDVRLEVECNGVTETPFRDPEMYR
jgi:hypothetical protein